MRRYLRYVFRWLVFTSMGADSWNVQVWHKHERERVRQELGLQKEQSPPVNEEERLQMRRTIDP